MNEARPYASLSSGLLARKGAAKPAMRPQSYGGFEDLGWNDMGYGQGDAPAAEAPEHVPSSIAALTPPPLGGRPDYAEFGEEAEEIEAFAPEAEVETQTQAEIADAAEPAPTVAAAPIEQAAPSVVVQQRAILERFDGAEEEAETPEPAVPAKAKKAAVVNLPKRKAAPRGRKAAFTLRLDADRHLRLRLACAVTGRSAQQIVTDALDQALAAIPEIDALAARAAGAKRN
ncbi:hypothetical protein [Sphingosinicella terrae]|uniref:hypothetical protein n=1 Tax=Sphingosinicella terrae TaxID=2172047 RepID=UPI000E0DDDC4|nr:hypothetical protein [Sphingosinicella terrae]